MIDKLLVEHENLKQKWLRLNIDDLFTWNTILEAMLDKKTELTSEYLEEKNKLENEKNIKRILYKDQKDDKWKKLHTENTIDSMINIDFWQQDKDMLLMKARIDMLNNKIQVIPEYINIVKKVLTI